MVEDISAQARLAVEISVTSSLIMTVVSLLSISLGISRNFQGNLDSAVQASKQAPLRVLTNQQCTTASDIYKVIMASELPVTAVEIVDGESSIRTLTKTGPTGSNFEYLLQYSSKKYEVQVSESGGIYTFKLMEEN